MKLKKVSKRHKGLFGNQHKNHSGFALESFGVVYPVLCNPCESKKKNQKDFYKEPSPEDGAMDLFKSMEKCLLNTGRPRFRLGVLNMSILIKC